MIYLYEVKLVGLFWDLPKIVSWWCVTDLLRLKMLLMVSNNNLQGKPNAGGPRIGEYRGVQETQKSSGESSKIKWRGQVRTVFKFGQKTKL